MKATKTDIRAAAPRLSEETAEFQTFGTVVRLPIALSQKVCESSVRALNQVLADTITLRDLYKKHHWQVSGPTFFQLHQLYDKHYEEQATLVDQIAERIQLLGGVSIAMAQDVADRTQIERPPMGRESVPIQISRLLAGHEEVLRGSHQAAEEAQKGGDDGTNDLLVSNVIRSNEFQVWFLAQHLVPTPVTESANESERELVAAK
jgi:starvation-inducible DNA-binding protein